MKLNKHLLFRLLPVAILPTILLSLLGILSFRQFTKSMNEVQSELEERSEKSILSGTNLMDDYASIHAKHNAFALENATRILEIEITRIQGMLVTLANRKGTAHFLRGNTDLRGYLRSSLIQEMQSLLDLSPCSGISLVDPEGRVLIALSQPIATEGTNEKNFEISRDGESQDVSKSLWFSDRIKSSELISTTIDWPSNEAIQTLRPRLSLAIPLRYAGANMSQTIGELYGYFQMHVPLQRLMDAIPQESFEEGTFILNSKQKNHTSNEDSSLGTNVGSIPVIQGMAELQLYVNQSYLDNSIIKLANANSANKQSLEDLFNQVETFNRGLQDQVANVLVALITFIVFAAWLVFRISTVVTRPIIQLEREASDIAQNYYRVPLSNTCSINEVENLTHSLEDMRQRLIHEIEKRDELVTDKTEALESTNKRLLKEVEERTKAEAKARAAVEAKSSFLAVMSHEIRTPLNGILGSLNLLYEERPEEEEEQRELVDIAESSANLLLSIVNDVLDFSKIEAGRLELSHDAFDLITLIRDIGNLFNSQSKTKNLDLQVEAHPSADRMFKGDVLRIKQILMNLVGNAVKFTDNGHVRLSARYTSEPEDKNPLLIFEISDSGIGIPEESLHKLFQPFEQLDTSTTRKFGGTGLGLSICDRLIKIMEGTVSVKSTTGQGSTFTVSLPLTPAEPTGGPQEPKAQQKRKGGRGNTKGSKYQDKMFKNWSA